MKSKQSKPAIPMPDAKWQAESDARMMMEHKKLMADPKRMKAAVSAAQNMAQEHAENAKAMKAVARKKVK